MDEQSTFEECIHGLDPSTCSLCLGRERTAPRSKRSAGSPERLDSPAAVEKYRSRYPGDRAPTFDAYVAVFFSTPGVSDFPGGWTKFSRCANAEPALADGEPELVERAESIMKAHGYVADDSRRGRIWHRMS